MCFPMIKLRDSIILFSFILYNKYVTMHMYQWLTIEAKSTSQKSLQLDCFIRTIDTPIFNNS